MRFYQIQASFCAEHGEWFTARREAEKRKREIERDGEECSDVWERNIPTTKKGLLAWLNIYGNPSGMGSC